MTAIPKTVDAALAVQYSLDGVTWQTFGRACALGSVTRSRRFGLPPGQSITAQYWRVVKLNPDPPGQDWGANVLRLDQVAFWAEQADLAPTEIGQVKLLGFNFDDALQRYIIPSTPGGFDVWRQGAYMAPAISPYDGDQLVAATKSQSLDTLVSFHQDVPPWRLMRQGQHYEWDSRQLAFDSLPIYDYDATGAGGVSEVQQLFFQSYVNGDTFNITLEGETTGAIAYTNVGATLAARIVTALEALPSVGAGQVAAASVATDTIQVTFQGTLANADIGTMAPVTLHSTAGGVSVANITQGKPGGEAIISTTRGWPATGCFYQQRLFMGGLKGRPETVLGSQLGAYFSFDTKGANAAGAINENMDTDQVTAIRSLFPGRDLQVFTNSAEFYFPTEPITPPANIKQSTGRGVQPGAPQVLMDKATIFVGAGGNALYEFAFDFLSDNYTANNLGVFHSHLVKGVVDMGYRKHKSTSESDVAILPRDTGDAAVMVALREQDITGFVPWTTQGAFLAAVGELGGDLYVATARTVGNVTRRFLERVDPARMLDCSSLISSGDARIDNDALALSGMDYLEGCLVCLYIDGADAGDVYVTDGVIKLPCQVQREIEVGFLFRARGVTLPMVFETDKRGGGNMAPRVGDIDFRLGPTANLKCRLAGTRNLWRVPLKARPGALLDQGPGESAFTGWTSVSMVPGFKPDVQIEFVQERPGPLQIKEIVARAVS